MNTEELEQNTQEWLDARVGKVTASRISDVLAKPRSKEQGEARTRANYKAQLVCERMTGKSAEPEIENWHMKRGKALEPDARTEYELHICDGELSTVGFVAHPEIENFGCSPDAYVGSEGMAQFKCPIPAIHLEYLNDKKKGQVPAEYRAQIQCELAVTGRKWSDFVSYNKQFPEHLQLVVIRAQRDEAFIKQLEAAVVFFNAEVDEVIANLPKE